MVKAPTAPTAQRSYEDGCAAAHALDLIGERWALLVARELMLGPKRFTDLRQGLPGISPNVLTQRLEELERASVLHRRQLPPPAAAWVYELTDWGRELETVIMAAGRWGARSPALPQGWPIGTDALVLSLRTMFSADALGDFEGRIGIVLDGAPFAAAFEAGALRLQRGACDRPDATIEAAPDVLAGLVYGGAKLAEAVRSGQVRVTGDKAVLKRFLSLFPLPASAPAADRADRSVGRTQRAAAVRRARPAVPASRR